MVSLDLTNFKWITIFISNRVGRVHWIGNALSMEVCPGDIWVIVWSVAGAVFSGRVPWAGFSPRDIIYLICLLCFSIVVPVLLRLCSSDVTHIHLVSDELRRCDRSHLNFSKLVGGVKRVHSDSVSGELHASWACAIDIAHIQICLRLI
jgi:hypothetical protein